MRNGRDPLSELVWVIQMNGAGSLPCELALASTHKRTGYPWIPIQSSPSITPPVDIVSPSCISLVATHRHPVAYSHDPHTSYYLGFIGGGNMAYSFNLLGRIRSTREKTKYLFFVCMALNCILLSESAFAMRPEKFTSSSNVDITFNKFRFISKQGIGSDGYSTDGITQLLDSKGKVLWSMPGFVGRQGTDLSPDGKVLVLSGNKYYGGGLFRPHRNEEIATMFNQGKLFKTVLFSDIFSEDAETLIKKLNVGIYGGGWAERSIFIKGQVIEWKQRVIKFTLYNGEAKKISF